jgi:hypothetical protein
LHYKALCEAAMTYNDLQQDLAYARALAEEGRRAPLLGGGYLSFWGALNACAFLAHWAVLIGRLLDLGGAAFGIIWGVYGLAAVIGMTALHFRTRDKPGRTAIGGRAERAVWTGAGIALTAIVAGSIGRMLLTHDQNAPNAIFGAAFAIYGAALFAVASLSGQLWMKRFAWLSAGVALTLCLFANDAWAYLYASVGSLLVLMWPGVLLLKHEPAPMA